MKDYKEYALFFDRNCKFNVVDVELMRYETNVEFYVGKLYLVDVLEIQNFGIEPCELLVHMCTKRSLVDCLRSHYGVNE